ncbi:MAG: hypothetical protein LBS28_04285 [Streptococcaceae bacterium]|jgi:RNA polymerase sporulation-specific sigma factor|nr:hypothetical protein [Streptococcaceae bacterium]
MFDLESEYRIYRPLVLKMYRTFAQKTMERDDFEQEARIVLWQTLKIYDENRQWSKGVCFKSNLKRWLISNYRKQYAKKRTNENGEPVEFVLEEYCDVASYQVIKHPDEEFIGKIDFINFLADFMTKHLSKMEKAAFIQWFGGKNINTNYPFPFKSNEQKKRAAMRAKQRFKRYYQDFYNN